jgi:16S rRNA (cytosine1402-N4)-methyltransferase
LGFCSAQLTDQKVGISFQENQPLDMRLDKSLEVTAADIINKYDEKSLADLIYEFGQERASRRIARFIVQQRKTSPIQTTAQLASLIVRAVGRYEPKRKKRIHPATRTFQALRIAVNHELENLEKLLLDCPELLGPGGKIAIISFHSLEDRIVKNDFRQKAAAGVYRILTKKPLTPTNEEIAQNKRARSAKLRIAEKL